MMILFFFLTMILSIDSSVEAHDTPLAMFHISQYEDNIVVDVSFHLEDFARSAKVKAEEVNDVVAQKYMEEHTNFRVNSKRIPLRVTHFSSKKNHIRVKGNLEGITEKVKSLKFKNLCLIDVMGHENIIYINLNGTTKDYRMSRRKKVIRVRY